MNSKNNDFLDIEIINPSEEENAVLKRLDKKYEAISLMSHEERFFLNALILRYKPVKLLEIGAAAGGSSIIMLNAINDDPAARLYSIDYAEFCILDEGRKSGYFVDEYPGLKTKFRIYTGGLALRFLDEIGGGIDFCFIDTVHSNPGEILDFLFALPYLKDDALVVFHDTKLQTRLSFPLNKWAITNNLLISAIFGKILVQGNFSRSDTEIEYPSERGITYFPNITAVRICKETKEHLYAIFNLLTIKWTYTPSMDEEIEIIDFFAKHYDKYYVEYMEDVFCYEKEFYAYKLPLIKSLLRPILNGIARFFNSGFKKKIRKLLGSKISNMIYGIMQSG
ncbi:MAG: class I SAM-dependent methyltransferase [Spirochaetaceae bacterium]|jgi:predicted O-methyltransferase YrrM|nr:class I SAM-dependent methyltransferase [Spirochaetaceae bacterium]